MVRSGPKLAWFRYSRLERDESVYGLACELVCGSDDGGLSNTLMQDEGGFDFGGRETVTRDVDDIYKAISSA